MINKFHMIVISFFMALGFLTRLPIAKKYQYHENIRFQRSLWAFPIVGVIIGALLMIAVLSLKLLALDLRIIAIIMFALNIMMTGALHEDGFADSIDGLWGGYDPQKRLDIMRDSHIGVYGVIALIIMAMLKIALFYQLLTIYSNDVWMLGAYIIMLYILSRGVILLMIISIPVVKQQGLATFLTDNTRFSDIWLGLLITLSISVLLAYFIIPIGHSVIMLCVALLVVFVWGRIAKAKINGYNGDILGALVVLTELLLLLVIVHLV